MDKNEYERLVYESSLCQTAKLVMLAYLHHCKQQELKEVWPAYKTVAEFAGVGRDTVSKYVTALVEQGWLVVANMHEPRLQGYEFGEAVAEPFGILAKPAKKVSERSKQNLKVGRGLPVAESIGEEVSDYLRAVAESTEAVAESVPEQLPNEVVAVADSTSAGKEENNNLEKTKEKRADAQPSFASSNTESSVSLPLSPDAARDEPLIGFKRVVIENHVRRQTKYRVEETLEAAYRLNEEGFNGRIEALYDEARAQIGETEW